MVKPWVSLRGLWYGTVVLMLLLPTLILTLWLATQVSNLLLERALASEARLNAGIQRQFDLEVARLVTVLENQSDAIGFALERPLEWRVLYQRLLKASLEREAALGAVQVMDPTGRILARVQRPGADPMRAMHVVPDAAELRVPLAGGIHVGSLHWHDGVAVLLISVPVGGRGHPTAVLTARVQVQTLWDTVVDTVGQPGDRTYLINHQGELLSQSGGADLLAPGTLLNHLEIVRCLLSGTDWGPLSSYAGVTGSKVFGVGSIMQKTGWGVITEIPHAQVLGPIHSAVWGLAGVALVSLLLFGGVGLWLTGLLFRWLSGLSRAFEQACEGNYDVPVAPSRVRELDQLADRFHFMAGQVKVREAGLRESEQSLRQSQTELQVLLKLSQTLERATDDGAIIQAVGAVVQDLLGYRNCWIYKLQDDPDYAELVSAAGDMADTARSVVQTLHIKEDAFLEATVAATGPLVVADARLDPRTDKQIVEALQSRTIVSVPLMLAGQRIGVLATGSFGDQGVQVPSPQQVDFFAAISGHVAVAMDRVRLLNTTRQAYADVARFFRAVDQSDDGVQIADADSRMIYVNPAFTQSTGWSSVEVLGQGVNLLRCAEHSDDFYERMYHTVSSGKVWRGDVWVRCKDGHAVLMHRTLSPVSDVEGHITSFVALDRDVTQERKLRHKLEQAQRVESLGLMAGGIAHDFNNILTAILGNAALARRSLSQPESLAQHLRRIEQGSNRAAELCGKMLAYAGKGQLEMQPFDLSERVSGMVELLSASVTKGVTMHYRLATGLPPLQADGAQLHQVAMNLVINAAEAARPSGGEVTVTTGVMIADAADLADTVANATRGPGRFIYLEVADTGQGMDAATQARIFDPFFSTKETGRGLGMSAVLGIMRSHQGALKLHSQVGYGTTFRALFPALDAAEVTAPKAVKTVDDADTWRGSGTVLVVDDEVVIRELCCTVIEALGFTTLTAADGKQGVKQFREHQGEVVAVLLDLTMPGLGGEAALRQIKALDPVVPVILCSGYSEQEVGERFGADEVAEVIQKPFRPARLQAALKKLFVNP